MNSSSQQGQALGPPQGLQGMRLHELHIINDQISSLQTAAHSGDQRLGRDACRRRQGLKTGRRQRRRQGRGPEPLSRAEIAIARTAGQPIVITHGCAALHLQRQAQIGDHPT